MNTILGAAFGLDASERRKIAVWQKGHPIPGYDPAMWRHDDFGDVIRYGDHGNRDSRYGWEIDHIRPVGLLGADDHSNLRPLNCRTNASLGGVLGGLLSKG